MPKIKILRSTMCDGERVLAGQTVDASKKDAALLIAQGQATEDLKAEVEMDEFAASQKGKKSTRAAGASE